MDKVDEMTPGGRYVSEDGTRWHDANGNDLGPVEIGTSEPAAEPAPKVTTKKAAAKAEG